MKHGPLTVTLLTNNNSNGTWFPSASQSSHPNLLLDDDFADSHSHIHPLGKKNMQIFLAKTSITLGFQMCDIIDITICWILEAKHKSDHFDSPLHHNLKGLEKHMKGSTGEQLPICCMETDLRD